MRKHLRLQNLCRKKILPKGTLLESKSMQWHYMTSYMRGVTEQLWQGRDINIEMPQQGMRLPGERALSPKGLCWICSTLSKGKQEKGVK